MSTLAGKSVFSFEPKLAVVMDATGTTATPAALAAKLGPLSQLNYKPSTFGYVLRLSSAPTTGTADVRLMAGATEVASFTISLSGATLMSDSAAVDLSAVSGDAVITAEIEVTAAADAGITGTLDTQLDVEQPLIISGC